MRPSFVFTTMSPKWCVGQYLGLGGFGVLHGIMAMAVHISTLETFLVGIPDT